MLEASPFSSASPWWLTQVVQSSAGSMTCIVCVLPKNWFSFLSVSFLLIYGKPWLLPNCLLHTENQLMALNTTAVCICASRELVRRAVAQNQDHHLITKTLPVMSLTPAMVSISQSTHLNQSNQRLCSPCQLSLSIILWLIIQAVTKRNERGPSERNGGGGGMSSNNMMKSNERGCNHSEGFICMVA